jgi:hypothetical protein
VNPRTKPGDDSGRVGRVECRSRFIVNCLGDKRRRHLDKGGTDGKRVTSMFRYGRVKIGGSLRRCSVPVMLVVLGAVLMSEPAFADFIKATKAAANGDYETARQEYEESAKAGDARAQNNLGRFYRLGKGGPVDLKQAIYWFTKASEQGQPNAETSLGDMYENGDGLTKDYNSARYWYLEASKSGLSVAQLSLGALLEAGKGGPTDNIRALAWYTLATQTPVSSSDRYLSEEKKKAEDSKMRLARRLSISDQRIAQDLVNHWTVGNDFPASLAASPTSTTASAFATSAATSTKASSVVPFTSVNAEGRLSEIQDGCDAGHGFHTFGAQVECIENGIRASSSGVPANVSGVLQLYTLSAENLADEVNRKTISQGAARVELQKAFLDCRDRLARQFSESAAKESALALQLQRDEQAANAAREAENDRRSNAQMIQAAQDREFARRQSELVAYCVATANQLIRSNPMYVNEHFFQGIHPDTSCAADPYWYKTIPSLQSQVGGRVLQ